MEQLIYVSTASRSVGGGDVFDIIQKSSARNAQRGVTGFLVFAAGVFVQFVEGEGAALDTLLQDLARDPRHHSVRVLDRRPCERRAFPGWKMKRLLVSEKADVLDALLKPLHSTRIPAEVLRETRELLKVQAA